MLSNYKNLWSCLILNIPINKIENEEGMTLLHFQKRDIIF
jgi:hypothetical protein